MLIHNQFIFVHVPKTGGTFLRNVLHRELEAGATEDERRHGGCRLIPDAFRDRPVLAYVRNPWDWYVSAFHFMKVFAAGRTDTLSLIVDDALLAAIFGNYSYDFKRAVSTACAGSLPLAKDDVTRIGAEGSPVDRLLLEGHDLYTSIVLGLTDPSEGAELDLTVCRFEHLLSDLELFAEAKGVDLSDGAFLRMRNTAPINRTDRLPYAQYYDGELRNLVAASCSSIIDRFGYTF